MKKYCCGVLHQLEDDSWDRGFGFNVTKNNKVEIFCVDDEGYTKRIDEHTFKFVTFAEVSFKE